MITYKEENPYDIKDELDPLAEEHYKGDPRSQSIDLDVDWDLYNVVYEQGSLAAVIARDEGTIVGYLSVVISEHQHTKGSKIAVMETIYVKDEYRNNKVATDLIVNMEKALIARDVDWFNTVFREEEAAEGVLCGLGYSKVEIIFGKSLKESS